MRFILVLALCIVSLLAFRKLGWPASYIGSLVSVSSSPTTSIMSRRPKAWYNLILRNGYPIIVHRFECIKIQSIYLLKAIALFKLHLQLCSPFVSASRYLSAHVRGFSYPMSEEPSSSSRITAKERPYRCEEENCRVKPFSNKHDLARHRREVHRKDSEGRPPREYHCPVVHCKRSVISNLIL